MKNRPRDRIRAKERATNRVKKRENKKKGEPKKRSEKKGVSKAHLYTHPHDPHHIANTRGHSGRESEVISGSLHLELLNERAVMCRLQPHLMPDSVHNKHFCKHKHLFLINFNITKMSQKLYPKLFTVKKTWYA